MVLGWCIRRSASSLASVCCRVARSQAVSVIVVNRSSLAPKPSSLLRSFVSRGFLYSTPTERFSSDDTLLQVIDSEISNAFEADDHDVGFIKTTVSGDFPFKIEDNLGDRAVID